MKTSHLLIVTVGVVALAMIFAWDGENFGKQDAKRAAGYSMSAAGALYLAALKTIKPKGGEDEST